MIKEGRRNVTNKKWFILAILLVFLIILFTMSWVYNYKIIDGNYDRLTITKMGETTHIITDKEEINKIINQINSSSRSFKLNSRFRYDYLPHGILIFENDKGTLEIGFVIPKGNILTKYWEIETEFEFGKDME
jgi:hypothetical protein